MRHRASETAPALDSLHQRPLLTMTEAAGYLNVSVRWLQDAVQRRQVRCTRIGKHVRFTREYLLELIAAGEQPVTQSLRTPANVGRGHPRRSRL
jgi:excisionase family DNA binding protein